MPEISVRGLEMPESPIRKLAPLAAAAKNKGIKVYHLTTRFTYPTSGIRCLEKH